MCGRASSSVSPAIAASAAGPQLQRQVSAARGMSSAVNRGRHDASPSLQP